MIYRISDFHFPDQVQRLYPDHSEGDWHLEIGFGDGRFWAKHQHQEPSANYLGVEVSGVSLLKAHRKLRQARDIISKMPAETLLRAVIPNQSLSRIYVNFPDPWPKADHLDHRLLRLSFFQMAAARLRIGGEIWLTTDHEEYFQFALAAAQESGYYHIEHPEPPEAALQTKYAQKWQAFGLSAFHARFRVHSQPEFSQAAHIQRIQDAEAEDTMPHSVLKQLPPLQDFQKQVYRYPQCTVVLLEVLSSVRRPAVQQVWIHVEEPDLIQEVMVGITQRQDGTTLVRLERFGSPIITKGVKHAVESVTAYLESRGAQVVLRAY